MDIDNNKKNRLLETAFRLFTDKGIKDTSIQDIVDNANVAKGTFYLYFKDKYEIRDILIAKKSHKLFSEALQELRNNYIENFSDQVVFVINYVIDELAKAPSLLKFISKNLSWGVFTETFLKLYELNENNKDGFYQLFLDGATKNNIPNPRIALFMIVELTGSTCFNSILFKEPVPIDEFKPYLYELIRKILKS
ncbi:MAG: TetR/AcrR family transcriptional regulator [Clostridia bacterium]|nr:TetR/AcrR family transcriptional regulator [Clostridia bacterium]